jgi:hypothetical protein
MPDTEIVSADKVLRESGAEKPVTEGTFLQRTGLRLAAGVGGLASVVILLLAIKWMLYDLPPVPAISADMDPTKAKLVIENYKELQQIAFQSFTSVFESIVVKVLLPVFTSILGYIYASRDSRAKE